MTLEDPTKADDGLLIDELSERLESIQLFRGSDDEQTNKLLETFGSSGVIEDQMLK